MAAKKPDFAPKDTAVAKVRRLHQKNTVAPPQPQIDENLPAWPRMVGDRINDGTIYAGLSPEKNSGVMFAMPADASVLMSFNEAARYADKMNAEKALGHDDWRVPTKRELSELWKHKDKGALAGTFNITAGFDDGFPSLYWSSTPVENDAVRAWAADFKTGDQRENLAQGAALSIRLVR